MMPIPRAAVSVCVRVCVTVDTASSPPATSESSVPNNNDSDHDNNNYYYLLVQRGTEPNQGQWSFPGGKIESGEAAVTAAMRELAEETVWTRNDNNNNNNIPKAEEGEGLLSQLQWYNGTITTTDAIGSGFHYLIAHCLAEFPPLHVTSPVQNHHRHHRHHHTLLPTTEPIVESLLPRVKAADDAVDVRWLTVPQIVSLTKHHDHKIDETTHRMTLTPGLLPVIVRMEELSRANLLPLTRMTMKRTPMNIESS